MELYLVPLMLFTSSILMAFAWLGHIKFRQKTFRPFLLKRLPSYNEIQKITFDGKEPTFERNKKALARSTAGKSTEFV